MEDKLVEGQSSVALKSRSRSESTLVAEKGRSDGCEGKSESGRKRVKLRDLDSVIRSEDVSKGGSGTRLPLDLNKVEANNAESLRGFKLDLNAKKAVSSTINKNIKRFKLAAENDSECASTTDGSLEKRDSMKVWKEMKQNGFLSSNSHGGIPIPKPPRVSKSSKNEMIIKQKMELAKKEQVDRFAKIAAPSGLLNGLNPGIINHVRNSKQVHSIIEALVQSEKQADIAKSTDNQHSGELLSVEEDDDDDDDDDDETSSETEERIFVNADVLKSNQESTSMNSTDVSHLSIKAADVASQWLDLLHQDINGRLAALQRSRKRVSAVIRTELPLLISTELSDQQLICMKSSSNNNNYNAHRTRWNALFDQMDKSLSDEEQKLENWLKQVKDMQIHSENMDSSRLTSSAADNNQERELAVRAAAASIYSTCNFLQSMEENQPCF
ncbi:uncharacterized protein LOC124926326 [Impatiens glandulifera]|uniref:uncharacterized protein LOC124926326 n=1 Tax=Impatiens glandulifera TaxID=253017 RepID=UPI001FB0A026|nr:uncharacterized protein LOC124926326 [Impatiens glandulifera]